MGHREQQRRERADKIWDDEGRPEGAQTITGNAPKTSMNSSNSNWTT